MKHFDKGTTDGIDLEKGSTDCITKTGGDRSTGDKSTIIDHIVKM
jgi:hypothetical protein